MCYPKQITNRNRPMKKKKKKPTDTTSLENKWRSTNKGRIEYKVGINLGVLFSR